MRAYKPDTFKTPGTKVSVNSGNSFIGVQITEKERDELVALRRESLMEMKPADAVEVVL